jgi:hypothetical protein
MNILCQWLMPVIILPHDSGNTLKPAADGAQARKSSMIAATSAG